MKTKNNLTFITSLCLISLFYFTSCQKEKQGSEENIIVEASASRINSKNGQKSEVQYNFATRAGHSRKSCNGNCGPMHKNCQGIGNACKLIWKMEVYSKEIESFKNSSKNNSEEFIFEGIAFYPEDISDDSSFTMPARSFSLEEENSWINIPEQTLERDRESACFIVKNITFTNSPKYINR